MGTTCSCSTVVPPEQPQVNRAPMAEPSLGLTKGSVSDLYEDQDGSLSENKSCYVVRNKQTTLEYACRKISKATAPCKDKTKVQEHLMALAKLEHPHLCKFLECFEDSQHYYMIYEKANKKLLDHVKEQETQKLNEAEVMSVVRQITMGLSLAHSRGIVHGRFSSDSVVVTAPEEEGEDVGGIQIKICDMGQGFIFRSCLVDDLKPNLQESTPPENVWVEVPSEGTVPDLAAKMDIWGLGVVMHVLLTGRLPFVADKDSLAPTQDVLKKIKTESVEYDPKFWGEMSQKANMFIRQVLQINPHMRTDAVKLLKHPYLERKKALVEDKVKHKLLGTMQSKLREGLFRKLVLRVVVRHLDRRSSQMDTIQKVFCSLDKDQDGTLSSKELLDGIRKCKFPDLHEDDLQPIFDVLDRDGSGSLNLQEFCVATIKEEHAFTEQNLWQAFSAFDPDKDGHITLDEVEIMARKLDGGFLSRQQLDEWCTQLREELDGVPEGKMDFDSFVYIVSSKPGMSSKNRALQRNCKRCCWGCCGYDCDEVRKLETKPWVLAEEGMAPQTTWSPYDKVRSSQHRASVAKAKDEEK